MKKKNSKNNKKRRKIILFGTKAMLDSFKNKEKQIFNIIDITYQIIPQKYKPYRILFIKSFNTEENKAILNVMLVIKYEDEKSLFYTFKYLIDFYGFNASILNIDYSLALIRL